MTSGERPGDPVHRSGRDPGDELVEWVDHDGRVIEVVTRRRMRADGLRHRSTYVVVVVGPADHFAADGAAERLDPDLEVVVHLRADWKDVAPSHWDLAFGGVCGIGESWETAARRELVEEAGIDLGSGHRLVDLGPMTYDEAPAGDSAGAAIVGRLYLAAWPGQPVSVDGEAVAFDRVALRHLEAWMTTVAVCADSAAVVAPALLARLSVI